MIYHCCAMNPLVLVYALPTDISVKLVCMQAMLDYYRVATVYT